MIAFPRHVSTSSGGEQDATLKNHTRNGRDRGRTDILHVLLIEDNPGDARLFREYLREGPGEIDFRWERELTEGLATVEKSPPDVIVLDLGLPDSEGPETVRRCVDRAAPIPVVVLTGTSRIETALQAQKAGAAEYLQKEELSSSLVERTLRWAHERAQMEKEIQRREARFQGLANSIPGVVFQFTVRPDGTYGFRFVSERAEDVLGISPEPDNFFGRVMERVPSSHQQEVQASIDEAVESETLWRTEAPFVRPSGERIWVLAASTPVRREGELIFNGVLLDITERKRIEEALRESERRFRKLIAESPIGITRIDPEGCVVEMNAAFCDMLGYGPGALRGCHVSSFTHEDDTDETTAMVGTLAAGERSSTTLEKRYRRRDGEAVWARVTASRLEHEGETQIISMIQDINDQKRYEEGLREAKEKAERMNRLKSALLANMSHEIRTPLTSILGFAQAIGEEVGSATTIDDINISTLKHFSGLIEKSGHRLMETLTGVLNLSKLEADEMSLSPRPIDVGNELREIHDQFHPRAEEEGISFLLDTSESSVWARADEGGLQIILRNLVSNALKYTDEGGTVSLRAVPAGSVVILEVEDTGIGMEPERVPALFEAFKQESEGMGREYEGTGLGLSVTRKAVKQMDGSIEVETEKGAGSCFRVRLPRAEDHRGDEQ